MRSDHFSLRNSPLKNRKTNPIISEMVDSLRQLSYESEAPIWKEISKRLAKSTRRMATVNVGRIALHTKAKDQVVVPGRVLGSGDLGHSVVVASVGFSERAREKILKAGGECIGLTELAERNPKGSDVKLMV